MTRRRDVRLDKLVAATLGSPSSSQVEGMHDVDRERCAKDLSPPASECETWTTMADLHVDERARRRWEQDGTFGRTGVGDPGEWRAAPCRQLETDVGLPRGSLTSATAADDWIRTAKPRQGRAKSAAKTEDKVRRAKVRRQKRGAKLEAKATEEAAKAATKAARARGPRKPKVAKKDPVRCPKCGKLGHASARSRQCWFCLGAETNWGWKGKPPEGQACPSPGGFGVSDFADTAAGAGRCTGVADCVDGPPGVGAGPSMVAEPSQTPSQQPVEPVVATGIRAPVASGRRGARVRVPSRKGNPLRVGWATKA